MKRVIVLLLCCLLPLHCAHADKPWRVFDNAGLYTDEEIETIETAILDFQRATNLDFVILTTDDYLGDAVTGDIAVFFYEHGAFGFGQDASGIIYCHDMSSGLTCLYTDGKAIDLFPDDQTIKVFQAMNDSVLKDEYGKAALEMLSATQQIILSSQTE